jgi:acyl-[acyl carrier protein]--UDP-N-acetylglucosamine O-acyltransferase
MFKLRNIKTSLTFAESIIPDVAMGNISHLSVIHPKAKIADDVEIGPFSIVHGNVEIHSGVKIGAYCELGVPTDLSDGSPLQIGRKSIIRSHSVFYESSSFGDELKTGHRVTVREHTVAGKNLQIGTLSDIQGDCRIGDYVRLHSNVHVGKKSVIADFVWIFPYAVLTNDPTPPSHTLIGASLGSYSVIATMSVVLPGVKIGEHALVAACACVGKDVPAYSVAAGVPARIVGHVSDIKLKNFPDESAYPWPRHFRRGYPDDVIDDWKVQFGDLG